ncbi:MAG: UDP-N-acetylmuramoyl-L-alanine--D-glutamate ligase [Clostridiaceae bacterium]|nr:UDP-N-acetylmuramoyl-L-alanine--D-glutamate ligase [Clostridiaceae bacterium]
MGNKERALVLGMARSGYEAAKLLAKKDLSVVINDAKTEQNPDRIRELEGLGVEVILGRHPEDLLDRHFDIMVKNPGIPNNHPYVDKALRLGVPVINEMELAFRYFPSGVTIIGVTGTNGKTTTATLISEMLKKASKPAHLMGNIGFPVCSFVPLLKGGDIAVMEVSDHQLCNVIEFKTHISVMTNLSEAHIDFHGSYETYKSMKKRIFNHHTEKDIAVLNLDDGEVLDLARDAKSIKRYFSSSPMSGPGCCIADRAVYYNDEKIMPLSDVKIKGRHNYENVMAAITAVKELGVGNEPIADVLKSFGGVEHRLEYVRTINQVDFYNDSKSTNVKSTQTALSSFDRPTILLLGGLDRGHSFDGLKEYLKWVKLIVAFGETKERIGKFASEQGIPCTVVDSLDDAVILAYESSSPGDVVLLSPACASWDQYESFEMRGNRFKECVSAL